MTICLIDTSIFCELLAIPKMYSNRAVIAAEFRNRADAHEVFLLPMATLVETGNHIGQNGNGDQRRQTAQRFVGQVSRAFQGTAPFTLTRFPEIGEFSGWLAAFPDRACEGIGLGDLTIIAEWERQRTLNPTRRVYIWSLDKHLSAFDTG